MEFIIINKKQKRRSPRRFIFSFIIIIIIRINVLILLTMSLVFICLFVVLFCFVLFCFSSYILASSTSTYTQTHTEILRIEPFSFMINKKGKQSHSKKNRELTFMLTTVFFFKAKSYD